MGGQEVSEDLINGETRINKQEGKSWIFQLNALLNAENYGGVA